MRDKNLWNPRGNHWWWKTSIPKGDLLVTKNLETREGTLCDKKFQTQGGTLEWQNIIKPKEVSFVMRNLPNHGGTLGWQKTCEIQGALGEEKFSKPNGGHLSDKKPAKPQGWHLATKFSKAKVGPLGDKTEGGQKIFQTQERIWR